MQGERKDSYSLSRAYLNHQTSTFSLCANGYMAKIIRYAALRYHTPFTLIS